MQENKFTELKREFTPDLNKEVVAFANTDGGKIYIGIGDGGTVYGVPETDAVILACTNHIRNTVRPDVMGFIQCSAVIMDGKSVIEIEVEKGSACPYYIAGKGIRPEGVYIRVGSASIPATESMILKMIRDTDGERYEDIRSLNQNLTFDESKKFFEDKGVEFGTVQQKTLGLINRDGLYTNLALLLSDECEHTVKVAVFEGIEKEIFKDRHEFTGSLLKQMADCYAFIDRYNRTQSTFQGLDRIDERDYPVEALREALMNSLVHREYALGGSTLINIFDDRIEFVSIGGLPKGIEYDDIMLGVSMPRNKKLANVFYRLRLIEAYGTGISKIMRSYKGGTDKPFIEVSSNAFKITLPNMKVIAEKVADDYDQYDSVLKLFDCNKQLTRADVEKKLGVSYATAVRILAKLVEQKRIIRIGNTRNTKYIRVE